jgi:probable rRNA maturation factor
VTRARLTVVVQDVARAPQTPAAAALRRWARAALGRQAAGELTIRIVGETESADLNRRYRAKSGPTNVLAFPGDGPVSPGAEAALGDLVVCAPVLAREALEQGKSIEAHWAHIVMHGALHLIGYDHATDEEAARMEARERELLADFGVADPYA